MMGQRAAAVRSVESAIEALGRGFDATLDNRLLYCKGQAGSRIVEFDEEHTRDVLVLDEIEIENVSRDIRTLQEQGGREPSVVRNFNEMAEYFNMKAGFSGAIPLGSFNSMFNFTGSKQTDAASSKTLAMDGVCIPLLKVQLVKYPLSLRDSVRKAIPSSWDPISLARFIENFGTHVITSVTIGGKDFIYAKQQHPFSLSAAVVKSYIQEIGDQRFSNPDGLTFSGQLRLRDRAGGIHPQPSGLSLPAGKDEVAITFRRRGGDDLVQDHSEWKRSVYLSPDVIEMTFCPITSLLDGVIGKDHLARAIDLYLENKPPVEDLRCFLEFQIPRIWAPIEIHQPGHQRREPVCPSLRLSLMGPKLYVSQEQVVIGRKPVTGLRLFLEGIKQNRLCVHVQHLASMPKILEPYWGSHIGIGPPMWLGPEEQDSRWFEPIKYRNFSHVSTAPVELSESFTGDLLGIYIVTGAQLGVWDFGNKSVLHMKLLFLKVPKGSIRTSFWDNDSVDMKDNVLKLETDVTSPSPSDSSTELSVHGGKLLKLVDMTEMSKGPQDSPGHWVVTGARLHVDRGMIGLQVKYSLLNC